MEISLLAMDLDGTALLDDHKSFTPRLYAALSAAAQKGVAIVPTTGRQYAMLPPAVHTGADWEDLCVRCASTPCVTSLSFPDLQRTTTCTLITQHKCG